MGKNARMVIVVAALAISVAGVGGYWVTSSGRRTQIPNAPTTMLSNVVINPKTRKPDLALQNWISSVTIVEGNGVYLNLGDRSGVGGSDTSQAIFLLSPVLKMYPSAPMIFTVSWHFSGSMGTDEIEFVYNRSKGTITSRYSERGKPLEPKAPLITGVTDAMIDSAASNFDSYTNVKNYS